MRITNRHNVEEVIYLASRNDKYSKGAADYSVTELIDSPQISYLKGKHHHEIERDVSDSIWSLLGTAVHSLLESSNVMDITEERLYTTILGTTISGGIDIQRESDLGIYIKDFKVTSVWSVLNPKPAWERQLNCYAHLVRANKDVEVLGLEVCVILRDWSRRDAKVNRNYPQSPIHTVKVPMWSPDEAFLYLCRRVSAHNEARSTGEMVCTPDERWETNPSFAAIKEGSAKARRVFPSEAEAREFAEGKGLTVVKRPGIPKRCLEFCSVSAWCPQWQEEGWVKP